MTFASGSAVRAFAEMTAVGADREDGAADADAGPEIICIGPVTAKAAQDAGLTVTAVAEDYTIEGLTECLCQLQNRE